MYCQSAPRPNAMKLHHDTYFSPQSACATQSGAVRFRPPHAAAHETNVARSFDLRELHVNSKIEPLLVTSFDHPCCVHHGCLRAATQGAVSSSQRGSRACV